jgi:Sulfatase
VACRRRWRPGALALRLGLALGLLAAAGSSGARGAIAAQRAPWDLLSLAASGGPAAGRSRVTSVTNFDQQRRVVAVPIPERLSYPVEIPPDAMLEFGTAIQSRMFSVDFIPKAGPTRFEVALTEDDGSRHVLHERVIDLRDDAADRRWFDERIDLAPFAGKRGVLSFSVERADDPAKPGATTALWAAPRIVRNLVPEDVNLLFVTIDCLRADHVGAYGYGRPTTPAIDRLAREGIRFANAFANAPMTLPSLPQIFTSAVFPEPRLETLVHPLAEAGVPTAAIVNNVWLVLWLARSSVPFDTVVSGDLMAERITDAALDWLGAHAGSRFALYLHYLDAHTPYGGPKRYARMFADPSYSGPIGDGFGDVEAANSGRFDERDKERIVALYDGQVRFIDDQLARVLDFLRERRLLERTVVVVSADHGEEFWDHGRFFHGQSLYDELLHIPLIVRLPGAQQGGTVVERDVRAIDIAPSLLDWMHLSSPATFAGRPLAEAIGAPDAAGDELIATATMGQFPTRYGIRTRDWKLVDTVDTGRRQLFDERSDPGETVDLARTDEARASELAGRLAAARRELAHEGVQLRIVGPKSGKARFRLVLKSASPSGVFETVDRTDGPTGADTRISLSSDGRDLAVYGTTDAGGRGFRFDRRLLLLAALGGKPDPILARLRVDGETAPPDAIELGAGHSLPPDRRFETSAPDAEAVSPPACAPPDRGVRVCIWRVPAVAPEPTPLPPPVADEAARERLRALGYVQ